MNFGGEDVVADVLDRLIPGSVKPANAWLLLEGWRGVWLGPLGHEVFVPSDYSRGRIFWGGGELRWLDLETGVWRLFYLGEESCPWALRELTELASELDPERPSRELSLILRGAGRVELGGLPRERNEHIALRALEYLNREGAPAFSRLVELHCRQWLPGEGVDAEG